MCNNNNNNNNNNKLPRCMASSVAMPDLPDDQWLQILADVGDLSAMIRVSKRMARLVIDTLMARLNVNRKQAIAFANIVLLQKSVFLTGGAGVGKTHIIKIIIERLRQVHGDKAVAVTASTGAAAMHVDGCTIHRFVGLCSAKSTAPSEVVDEHGVPVPVDGQDQFIDGEMTIRHSDTTKRILKKTRVLILEEISMISAETLGLIDRALREARRSSAPFGGLQMVVGGDFCQLPPVINEEQAKRTKLVYAFESNSWKNLDPRVLQLTEVMRQDPTEMRFIQVLNRWREGDAHAADFEFLKENSRGDSMNAPVALFATHKKVDARNHAMLDATTGHTIEVAAIDQGNPIANRGIPAPQMLALKIGCSVVAQCNQYDEDGTLAYANGSTGTLLQIRPKSLRVKWHDDGRVGKMHRKTYVREKMVKPSSTSTGTVKKIFKRSQYPVKVSFAMTHHKAQGATVRGRVDLDLTGGSRKDPTTGKWVPTAGRLYTVLSRLVSLGQARFLRNSGNGAIGYVSDVFCDPSVKAFYRTAKESIPSFLL